MLINRLPKPGILLSLGLLMLLGASSCKTTTNITASAPDAGPSVAPNIPVIPSVINVPVTVPAKQLENRINQEFTGVIYKDDNINDDNMEMTVTKNGPIQVNADNNMVYFTIPLHIWIKGRWQYKACSFCPNLSATQSGEFDIVVKTQSAIAVNDKWQLVTSTTGDYNWGNQRPCIDVGPVSIPVSSAIDLALKPQLPKIFARLDQEILKRVTLKDYILKAWTAAQQPYLVDRDYNTWLVITPTALSATPMQAKAGQLTMTIGITANIFTISGEMPHPVINNTLPPLQKNDGKADAFNISLSAEAKYDFATTILQKEFNGYTYTYDNKYVIKVDSIFLSGSQDNVLIRLDVEAMQKNGGKPVKGTIYMQGQPYYDPADTSLKVRNLDYSLKTKNVLVRSANWILKSGLENEVKKYLVFSIRDRLHQTKTMIQNTMNTNNRINNNAYYKGTINSIEPQGVYITPYSMKAVVNAKGKISIVVDKL